MAPPATVGSNTTVIGTILEFSFSFVTISLCGIQFTVRISKHHRPIQACYWPLPSEACLTQSLGTMTRKKVEQFLAALRCSDETRRDH